MMRASLDKMPKEGRNISELALRTAETMHPPEGASVTHVEPDGLLYLSRGTPTALLGAVVLGGVVAYLTMARPVERKNTPHPEPPLTAPPIPASPSPAPSSPGTW